jgi:hypothetical protein
MIECPYCYRVYRQPPEKMGARCPKCRMPLYEDPARRRKTAENNQGTCALHPGVPAVAKCGRCNNPLCQTCRTRWQEEIACPSCVDHSILDDEASPQEAHLQTRQAWVSVILGLVGWMLFLLTLAPLSTFHQPSVQKMMIFGVYFFFLFSILPSLFGLGHALAALRLRGDYRTLATCGLVCAGSQIGLALGIIVINIWHN